jgi:hypothetical protein
MKGFPTQRNNNRLHTTNRWAVILAGGDGTRLRSFTRAITGDERPKQFAPVIGGQTFFQALIPVFGTPEEFPSLQTLYSWLPDVNFSREVLALRPDDLGVMKVDNVGWSDLGDPSRVLATLRRMGADLQAARSAS